MSALAPTSPRRVSRRARRRHTHTRRASTGSGAKGRSGLRLGLLLVVAAIALLVTGCKQGWDGRTLSGPEIQKLFAGKTVTGRHEKRGYAFQSYYEPTGTFRSYQGGAKTPRKGRWWVDHGNDICIRWLDTSEQFCRKMVTDGKGHYWKVLIKPGGRRILIVTFERFEDGNPKGL